MAGGMEGRTKEKKQRERKKVKRTFFKTVLHLLSSLVFHPKEYSRYFSSNSSFFAPVLEYNGCFQTGSLLTPSFRSTKHEEESLPLPQPPNDKKEKDVLLD